MEEKRIGGKIRAVLGWSLAVFVALALSLAVYIGFFADRLLPEFCSRQLSPVVQRDMGAALPEGSLAVVDKGERPEAGEVAAYWNQEGRMMFGRVRSKSGSELLLQGDLGGEEKRLDQSQAAGTVRLYISRLGGLATVLAAYRLTVAATAAVYLLVFLAAVFTRDQRLRNRRRRELIELFAFYGEKYDMEESDIDY